MGSTSHVIRGGYVRFNHNPFEQSNSNALDYQRDGIVVMADGIIQQIGPASDILPLLDSDVLITHLPHTHIMCAGFIDTHAHYPQLRMIGAAGKQLLDWLNHYIFPIEAECKNSLKATKLASFFIQECLRNGTTTFATFCTMHPSSVDALFTAASELNIRCIAGKVLMDRNCPEQLRDTAESGFIESNQLIERWHQIGRNQYAITPRFVPSCSNQQLRTVAELWNMHPTTYLQSHVAESKEEVEWVKQLHPNARSYLDIYDQFGLLGPRALYAHGIWLSTADRDRLFESNTRLIHCPSSNLFLGSGLLNIKPFLQSGRSELLGIATDVGAGTSLSMLRTLGEAYKVGQLNGYVLSGTQGLYWMTQGNATSLHLQDKVGNLDAGKEADIVVIDTEATSLLSKRVQQSQSIEDVLSALMTLGDDRCIVTTYIAGQVQFSRLEYDHELNIKPGQSLAIER